MDNSTATVFVYTVGQKVALPFVFLPCLLLSFVMYRYAKKRLLDAETFAKRMQYFYGAIGGGLIGQFLFHVSPKGVAAADSLDSVFVFIGYFIMVCIQKFTRVNNENEHYTSPSLPSFEIKQTLDGNDMQLDEYYQASNLDEAVENGHTSFGLDMLTIMDENKELYKRRLLSVLFYVPMVYISFIEGFFLMYRSKASVDATIAIFYANKLIQTFIVCTVLLHGMFHVKRNGWKHWYFTLSVGYCTVCMLSSIPVLTGVNMTIFLEHVIVSKIYLLISGTILYIAVYFAWLDRRQTNKKETIIGLVFMALFGAGSYATGIFI